MANIKATKYFEQVFNETLDYSLKEFGATTVKRFYLDYKQIKKRLASHPLSSPREPLLKKLLRPYRSAIIMQNWKIIYRYDEAYDRVIFVDLWDMRMNPKSIIRQFKRKL